jgi:hypothetical protein
MSIKTQGHGEKFSRRKEAAIAALLQYPTLPEAAANCGLSPRTLRRWLANEEFEKAYRTSRTKLLEGTLNLLTRKSFAAAETLASIADGSIVPTASRFSAARAVVELAIRGAELQEFEERLAELEEFATRDR